MKLLQVNELKKKNYIYTYMCDVGFGFIIYLEENTNIIANPYFYLHFNIGNNIFFLQFSLKIIYDSIFSSDISRYGYQEGWFSTKYNVLL